MHIAHHKVSSHSCLDLSSAGDHALHVLETSGRNLLVEIPAKWVSIWLPLSGGIDFETSHYGWNLARGDFLAWRDQPLRASSIRATWGLSVCGSQSAWDLLLNARPARLGQTTDLFLSEQRCPRTLARLLVHLARTARRSAGGEVVQASAAAFAGELLACQSSQQALLSRCNGRTRQRRNQTLMRLLRVEHLIRKHEDSRLDLSYLAASANYSPCHLIRCYRDVFGETPAEYATRLRAERAWRLVRETSMPVCEITEAVGFESQSAFCRAFKNIYGMTTSQARNRLDDAQPAARAA